MLSPCTASHKLLPHAAVAVTRARVEAIRVARKLLEEQAELDVFVSKFLFALASRVRVLPTILTQRRVVDRAEPLLFAHVEAENRAVALAHKHEPLLPAVIHPRGALAEALHEPDLLLSHDELLHHKRHRFRVSVGRERTRFEAIEFEVE